MSKFRVIATKDGVTRVFRQVEWAMLCDSRGDHDGWKKVDKSDNGSKQIAEKPVMPKNIMVAKEKSKAPGDAGCGCSQ